MKSIIPILLILLTLSCNKKDDSVSKKYEFNFNENVQGWNGLFSDSGRYAGQGRCVASAVE